METTELEILQNRLAKNPSDDKVLTTKDFHFNHFGCLLFDCQTCGNLIAD